MSLMNSDTTFVYYLVVETSNEINWVDVQFKQSLSDVYSTIHILQSSPRTIHKHYNIIYIVYTHPHIWTCVPPKKKFPIKFSILYRFGLRNHL